MDRRNKLPAGIFWYPSVWIWHWQTNAISRIKPSRTAIMANLLLHPQTVANFPVGTFNPRDKNIWKLSASFLGNSQPRAGLFYKFLNLPPSFFQSFREIIKLVQVWFLCSPGVLYSCSNARIISASNWIGCSLILLFMVLTIDNTRLFQNPLNPPQIKKRQSPFWSGCSILSHTSWSC